MSKSPDVVLFEIRDKVGWITLNRPEVLNAANTELVTAARQYVDQVRVDDGITALVITGAGRGFCSGADLRGLVQGDSRSEMKLEHNGMQRLTSELYYLNKPVIAAINGPAAGAGFEMSLAADIRIAAESAFFQMAAVRHGLIPGDGSVMLLPRIIGAARAIDLLITERRMPAEEAKLAGLVREVVPDAALQSFTQQLAVQLGSIEGNAIGLTKQAVRLGLGGPELDSIFAFLQIAVAQGKVARAARKPESND
jgi:2-(1,2-epoxy-1,2-dihydrophenyl)acetyl-CoA isomerase